jgi:general secretion pathway protein F
MKYDELAFVNLQLAGMLRSGIPLEGALRQLSQTMRRGRLQAQFESLEADLKNGVPIRDALEGRQLPDLYRRMMVVGVQGNDLPGVLTLLADHYQRMNAIGTRLKGLMVYPVIVMLGSLALSVFLALFFRAFATELPHTLSDADPDMIASPAIMALIWIPVILLALLTVTGLITILIPPFRRWLRWRTPGFKEAALAQLASAMRLMLKAGTNLADALGLLRCLETNTPAGPDLALWQRRLAEGHARFPDLASGSRNIPPLFAWLVSSGGEDLAQGFERAAQIYQARATYRIEMLLYAALPVSILCVGLMVISQAYPVIRLFVQFGTMLDRLGR